MARESFDKEIQFLRLLALAGGAYSRQQFASRLGISVHTYDKTLRYLKDMRASLGRQTLSSAQETDLTDGFRYNYYETADPLLLFLFRAKAVKASESARLSLIVALLQEQALTASEILDACSDGMPPDLPCPDEKTIRADLKYLEEVGVLARADGGRPYRYRAANELIDRLTDEELLDLYDYVDVLAGTQVPAVQGYLLRDTLKKALRRRGFDAAATETHLYKYHYHSRILDEAHLFPIASAIRSRRMLHFLYLSPKRGKTYASKNTNPLFERDTEGKTIAALPLRVVYDHQYGRWYLIGYKSGAGTVSYRMEGMTQIAEGEAVPEADFAARQREMERRTERSWVTDTTRPVKVVARFYNPERAGANFIRERVEAQGQWGTLTEESEAAFRYEITVNGTSEIKPWLRSFGSSCEVLEPASLREEFIAEWKELRAYYESVRENI
ncbi:helix-turn-helix transcriptional regulator [Paenibacillus cymbidii]|uniref:helix-turn-helix transcriptional regulator n=1 Tax=Paenibacillus cymbidii TaxID=1639034 RepID=UPI001080AA79|nr:WYL domain-containing protein [Paenibacillus cymbidii]